MSFNDFFTNLTNKVGGYLVQSEIDAGVRSPDGSFKSAEGANPGILGSAPSIPVLSPPVVSARSPSSGYSTPSVSQLSYVDAPLAQAYGMDASTAYQEALANSAHQREVQDLIKAGLNPVLSAGHGSGSAVFAGSEVSSGSSGSFGGSSAKNAGLISSVLSGLPFIVGGATMLLTKNPKIASVAGNGAKMLTQGIVNSIT